MQLLHVDGEGRGSSNPHGLLVLSIHATMQAYLMQFANHRDCHL